MLLEHLDTRSNNGQNLSFIITHACKSLSAHWWPSICEVCDVKICWRFCSSALGDRRDLENEEQTSALQCRTKERRISTALRSVLRPLLVSAGLTFCHQTTGCSMPFSLTAWTLTCQKKKGGGEKKREEMNSFDSVLLFSGIFSSLGQSLSEPFVWGSSGERLRQSVCERKRER